MTTLTHEDCLQHGDGRCEGETLFRESLSGTGTPIKRCDRHWELRLEQHARHLEVYPDSPLAPAWFDPADAGERWDSDY